MLRTIYGPIYNPEIQAYERRSKKKHKKIYKIGQKFSRLLGENDYNGLGMHGKQMDT